MSIRGVGNAKSLGLHCINSKIVKFIMPVSIAKVLLSLVEFSLEPGTRTHRVDIWNFERIRLKVIIKGDRARANNYC